MRLYVFFCVFVLFMVFLLNFVPQMCVCAEKTEQCIRENDLFKGKL